MNLARPLPRQIVCAAIRKNGLIICGARHFDEIMRGVIKAMPEPNYCKWEQGFIDQKGIFLTRQEAFTLAKERGQIQTKTGSPDIPTLISEDLY